MRDLKLQGEFDTFGDMWWFPHAATIAFFFSFAGVCSEKLGQASVRADLLCVRHFI